MFRFNAPDGVAHASTKQACQVVAATYASQFPPEHRHLLGLAVRVLTRARSLVAIRRACFRSGAHRPSHPHPSVAADPRLRSPLPENSTTRSPMMHPARPRISVNGASTLLLAVIVQVALFGCHSPSPTPPVYPHNHAPLIDSLIAIPDTIGSSDSTVVTCFATDPDGDSLVYDWLTDARLQIKGARPGDPFLNAQPSPSCTFYNANLPNPINDSAWVYCSAQDRRGGGVGRHVFIILRPPAIAR